MLYKVRVYQQLGYTSACMYSHLQVKYTATLGDIITRITRIKRELF